MAITSTQYNPETGEMVEDAYVRIHHVDAGLIIAFVYESAEARQAWAPPMNVAEIPFRPDESDGAPAPIVQAYHALKAMKVTLPPLEKTEVLPDGSPNPRARPEVVERFPDAQDA